MMMKKGDRTMPRNLGAAIGAPSDVLRAPDVNWGGRFDRPETVSNDVPKPDTDVKLPTVETDSQIDSVMKQAADLKARLDKLVAENPHWGRLR
jgi:hypothetical protein